MEEAKRKAQAIYNAASDFYDDPANSYWERYGRKTIERLNLVSGSRILDVACGTGASALPAAEILKQTGHVIGIDLAENLLALGRAKAKARGLQNIEFQQGDMTRSGFNDGVFDAVVCVFGIFFVPDMEALVAELWRMVKRGGKLAITTLGPDLFEPMYSTFDEAVKRQRPDLVSEYRPWDRITTETAVEQLLVAGGGTKVTVETELGEQELHNKDSWWKIVLGSGLRGVVEAMGSELAERVRSENLTYIKAQGIDSIVINVIYGVARK
jgi:ubiquinone/menaquinone biosynthesis C-methylase UbiE